MARNINESGRKRLSFQYIPKRNLLECSFTTFTFPFGSITVIPAMYVKAARSTCRLRMLISCIQAKASTSISTPRKAFV